MTVEFVDEAGTAIQATMWKDAIDKYDAIMEVGKVYYVSRGSLRPANRQYSNVNNDYEMSLDGRCEIELCTEAVDVSKMSRAYELVKIDALPQKIGGRGSVDVLAVVTSVGELGSVRRKSDNAEIQRRDVVLLDETKRTVSLTLWNSLAVEQGEQLANMTAPIIAVRGLRVTDYNGVSLSTVARSELFVEPETEDVASRVADLRAWYDAEGATAETTAAGAGLATARGAATGASAAARTTLAAMQPELLPPATAKPEMGVVLAAATLIKPDQPMYYAACPEEGNNKKVVEENGKWYCEATQKTYDTCRRRYILRMKVSDASGAGWVNVFHEQACEMLGVDAETLHKLRESDPAAYERRVKAAQFDTWSLKIKSKTEEYQGESRRRLTVAHCARPDYAAGEAPPVAHPGQLNVHAREENVRGRSSRNRRKRVRAREGNLSSDNSPRIDRRARRRVAKEISHTLHNVINRKTAPTSRPGGARHGHDPSRGVRIARARPFPNPPRSSRGAMASSRRSISARTWLPRASVRRDSPAWSQPRSWCIPLTAICTKDSL